MAVMMAMARTARRKAPKAGKDIVWAMFLVVVSGFCGCGSDRGGFVRDPWRIGSWFWSLEWDCLWMMVVQVMSVVCIDGRDEYNWS